MDFIICLLIASPFILACTVFRKPLARKLDEFNRKANIEHQIIRGKRDGELTREVVTRMRREGRL